MWNSYARAGVAIKTTFGQVELAIKGSSALQGAKWMAVPVAYHYDGYRIPEVFDEERPNGPWIKHPYRPYEYKLKSYEFEREVRLVFRINCPPDFPADCRFPPGIRADIDPHVMLSSGSVVISPYIHPDERYALRDLVEEVLEDKGIDVTCSAERSVAGEHVERWMTKLPPLSGESSRRCGVEPGLPELLLEL
jgi:hypothetical protein